MFLISHRGNIDGPNKQMENSPSYVDYALQEGFDVEIDVWLTKGSLTLGHDEPQYEVTIEYLRNKKLWCHCKNIKALECLLKEGIRCFFHDRDTATLTSDGYIWTYPGCELTPASICVMPELFKNQKILDIAGICSDNIKDYR